MNGMLVDWNAILRSPVRVRFNSLVIPEDRLPFEKSVAQIDLVDNSKLDIAWAARKACYVITVYRDNYHEPISRIEVRRPEQVVDRVRSIVDQDNFATLYGGGGHDPFVGCRGVAFHGDMYRGALTGPVSAGFKFASNTNTNTNTALFTVVGPTAVNPAPNPAYALAH